MQVSGLHAWHYPDQMLDRLTLLDPFSKQIHDAIGEARIIALFARLVFPGKRCEVRLRREVFPDAEIRILDSGYIKHIEITQAFEGGDNSPNRKSVFAEMCEGDSDHPMTESEFIRGLHLAVQRKVAKHYANKPHLLVHVTNIPTWGKAEQYVEEHLEEFAVYRRHFSSLSILTHEGRDAVQILPKFKVFREIMQ